jgi:hypothetical protein
MAGKLFLSSPGGGTPGGNDKQVQFNDSGGFAGGAQLFWDKANDRLGLGDSTPGHQLSLTKCMELLDTTTSAIGVVYKGNTRWLHNFQHPTGGGAIPNGMNVFLGKDAGNFTTGSTATSTWYSSKLVGIGNQALQANVLGYECVAVGNQALMSNLDGQRNMAVGTGASQYSTAGSSNMALGRYALHNNVLGSYNTIVGSNAALGVFGTSIYYNTIVGFEAGKLLTTNGYRNIFMGYKAADNVTSGARNIIIGFDLDALAAAGNYQLNIGSLIFGDLGATKKLGVNTSTLNETLNVGGAIRLGTTALTNAGAIRWNGTNFEGYNAAWLKLDHKPGGSNTQVQFNNSGIFAGDSDFTWASATNLLNLANAEIQSKDSATGDFSLVSTPLVHSWAWDYRAANFIQNRQAKVLATDGSSFSFCAGLALHHVDSDGTNYQTSGTIHQMYGLECHLLGTTTNASYKDMVGVFSRVMNRTEWNLRGCSGFITGVHQYGEGIASNEFHIFDPGAGAEGGHAQCKSSAGLQIVMHHHFADEDATHLARGLMIDVFGKRITAGIIMSSNVDGGFGSGHLKYAIDMASADVSTSAIKMPGSAAGSAGTIIEYDPNDYSWYDRTNNNYNFVAEGVTGLVVGGNMANAVAIRVNSTLLYIQRSADTDGAGKHYLVVT